MCIRDSAHVARATHQLAGLFVFRVSGVLVAVPLGSRAAPGGRGRGPGIARRYAERSMKSETYLYIAYGVTWLIHIIYLGTLVRRYSRLHREIEELERM